MSQMKAAVVTMLVLLAGSTETRLARAEGGVQVDPCGCGAALAKDTKANILIEDSYRRLEKWFSLDDEKLYQQTKSSEWDAEIGWNSFGANGGGGTKQEVIQKARQRIAQRVDEESQHAIRSITNESTTTKEALEEWRACAIECINKTARPLPGLGASLLDSEFGPVVRMRVKFVPDQYVGPPPTITKVSAFGLLNGAEVETALTGRPLGAYELALRRDNVERTTATVTIWTDIWGAVTAILRPLPPNDLVREWHDFARFSFARGLPFVASTGTFEDSIVVEWADISDPAFKEADVIEIMASLEPDPYAHRHFWWAVPARASNSFKLTPDLWKMGAHGDIRKQLGIEEMPSNTPIYIHIGFAWGPKESRSFRLVGPRYVTGWIATPKISDASQTTASAPLTR